MQSAAVTQAVWLGYIDIGNNFEMLVPDLSYCWSILYNGDQHKDLVKTS